MTTAAPGSCPSCNATAEQIACGPHRYRNPIRECVQTFTAIQCENGRPVPSTIHRAVLAAFAVERADRIRDAFNEVLDAAE